MKDFAKSIHVGNAGEVVHRDGDFKIKYNEKENGYELYYKSIYYDTYHTKQQALDKIELHKKREEDRKKSGNSKVGNSSHTKEEAKTKDEYFKILKFYQTQGYKTKAGEYNPNGRIKLHKGDDSVEIVLVGNSKVGNADVVKDGNVWVVVYAEGTKSKEFNSEEEAKKFAAQVGNTNVTPVSKPNAPVKDPKKEDKEKDKDKKPSDPKDKEGYTFKERVKQVTGNSTEKLFHSLEKDVEKKEEKNDEEIDEVGNRLDWSENLVGKYVWVKSKGDEWKVYVMQDKGDKVYIRDDSDGSQGWVSKERITGKVSNSKSCNSSEYDILKQDPSKMHPAYKKAYEEALKKLSKEDEEMKKRFEREYGVKAKNEASDDKFAYVMREFDEGKLKTPDGKVVTDPAQAKAIAYSESKKNRKRLCKSKKRN